VSRERRTIPVLPRSGAGDCPLAPPQHASVYARTLHRACLILGSMDQLATHLGVSQTDLRRWLAEEEEPPHRVFLAAVEVVLLYAGSTGRIN
jgi:hypothetical protein